MNPVLPRDIADLDDPHALLHRTNQRINHLKARISDLDVVRNRATVALHAAGHSYRNLAVTRGLGSTRIGDFVAAAGPDVLEIFRAWHSITVQLQGLVSGVDHSIALASQLGLEPKLLAEIRALRTEYSRYLHTEAKPTNDEANDFADAATVLNAKLLLWTRAQRGNSVTAQFPNDDRSHQAWRISGTPEVATACGLTGVPVDVDPGDGWLCPECHAATK